MCGSQKTLSRLTFSRTFIRILNTVLKRKGESSNNEVLFLVPVASAAYGEFYEEDQQLCAAVTFPFLYSSGVSDVI